MNCEANCNVQPTSRRSETKRKFSEASSVLRGRATEWSGYPPQADVAERSR